MNKAVEFIRKYKMIDKNDNVLVGVSGGADSIALLHFFCQNKQKMNINIFAAHINHNLRGEESNRDMNFVKNACEDLKIPLYILSKDIKAIAKQRKIGTEECGREIRYEFLKKIADEITNCKIATAHNLDDNIETVIFNLARGSTLDGMCGIKPVRGNIIRPFLSTSRGEIEQYLKQNSISFIVDSSNLSTEYTRNKIRHNIVPELNQINPNYLSAFSNLLDGLIDDNIFIKKICKTEYQKAYTDNTLNVKMLLTLDDVILNRIIVMYLKNNNISFTNKTIIQVNKAINALQGTVNLNKHKYLIINKNKIFIDEKKINIQPYFEFGLKNSNVHIIEINKFNKINKSLLLCYLDYDKIKGIVTFRQKKQGDFIRLSHNPQKKSLKKLFNEKKVPVEQRNKLIIGADDNGVFFVEGFGIDQRVIIDENTKNVLILKENDNGQ